MQKTITQVSPAEYELEITAPAEDLAPDFQKALRSQQARTQMNGFRVGKVPLGIVKKRHGEALAFSLVDKLIQETYEETVLKDEAYDVLGQPVITDLDYEMDSDLRAVIRFGVRPEVVLQDFSREQVTKLVHAVTGEEVEEELQTLLQERADLVPVEDEPAGEADYVVFDLQELDPATGTAIIGKRDEDQSIFLDTPEAKDNLLLGALVKALQGAKVGDTVRFHFEHDKAHSQHDAGHDHAHHFMATVKEVKRRDVAELDDDFVQEITEGKIEDVASFQAEVRKQIEGVWARRSREILESNIVERMQALHPVPVPESVIQIYLDSFVEDVKRRNDGELPENFPVDAFRQSNRGEAEQQARWMLIRDKVIEQEGLAVTDEDMDAFFNKEADDDGRLTTVQMRQFYEAVPQLKEQLEQRLISEKVFAVLADQFEVVEKDRDAYEEELATRRARALADSETSEEDIAEVPAEKE